MTGRCWFWIWIFCCALASNLGPAAAQVGTLVAVVFVVSAEHKIVGQHGPWGMGGLFLVGGCWATGLSLLLWRFRPTLPMRAALVSAFHELSLLTGDMVRLGGEADAAPEVWDAHARRYRSAVRSAVESARSSAAYLPRLSRRANYEGMRLRLLVEEADRLLGRLVALADVIQRLLESAPEPLPVPLRRALARLKATLQAFADALSGSPEGNARRWGRTATYLESLHQAVERACGEDQEETEREAWQFLGDLVEQLQTTLTLAHEPGAVYDGALPGNEPARRRQRLRIFAEGLSIKSPVMRHAFRSAITVTIAEAVVMRLAATYPEFQNGYWLTMTTLLVLQPFVAGTLEKTWQRSAASALGGALAALAGLALHSPLDRLALIVPLIILTMTVRPFHYGWYIFFLTPLFVLVADFGNPGRHVIALAEWRVFDTLGGGLLALAGGLLLWPNWESSRLPGQLAEAITWGGAYVRLCALTQAAALGAVEVAPPAADVRNSRRQAGLASNGAELSLQRLLVEPNRKLLDPDCLAEVLAALRRLAGAGSALWLRAQHAHGGLVDGAEYQALADWAASTTAKLSESARDGAYPGEWVEFDNPHGGAIRPDVARIAGQFRAIHRALSRAVGEEPKRHAAKNARNLGEFWR